jgi:hypothetical protein
VKEIIDNQLVCIVARKGGGKSYQLRHLLADDPHSFVIYDVRHEYDSPLVAHVIEENPDDPEEAFELLKDYITWSATTGKRAGVSFVPDSPEDSIDQFCNLLFENFRGLTIAFEETPAYSSPGSMPKGLERLVLQARHKRHDLYFVGQRYAEMNRSLTAMCDFHCIGSTKEPRDLMALQERIGEEGAKRVSELPTREWITYSVEDGSISEGVVIR